MDVSKMQEEIRRTLDEQRVAEELRETVDFLMWEQEWMNR